MPAGDIYISKFQELSSDTPGGDGSVNIAILALGAIQMAAALAEEGRDGEALEHLQKTEALMRRSVVTMRQEEHYIFLQEVKQLEPELKKKGKRGDAGVKLLHAKKNISLDKLLSAPGKLETINQRTNTDVELPGLGFVQSQTGFGRTVDKTRFKPDKTGQNYFIVSVNT